MKLCFPGNKVFEIKKLVIYIIYVYMCTLASFCSKWKLLRRSMGTESRSRIQKIQFSKKCKSLRGTCLDLQLIVPPEKYLFVYQYGKHNCRRYEGAFTLCERESDFSLETYFSIYFPMVNGKIFFSSDVASNQPM